MRRLPILKALVQILFALCLIAVFFGVPLLLIVILMPTKVPSDFFDHSLTTRHFEVTFLLATLLLAHCTFTYGVYLLKKTLDLFTKKKFFDASVITFLDQSGKAFIIAGILWIVPLFFYKLLAVNKMVFDIDLGLPFFAMCLGFLFMVLSEVFLVAKGIKQKNDLTI